MRNTPSKQVFDFVFVVSVAFFALSAPAQQASFQGLGDLAGGATNSGARGVSSDGSVVVGHANNADGLVAFVWDANNGMHPLPDVPPLEQGDRETAYAISSDQRVIVGFASYFDISHRNEAACWNEGVPHRLGFLGTGDESQALAVSADGSVVVGSGRYFGGLFHAFRWEDGTMVDLGDLGGGNSKALAVSADGSIIVGFAQNTDLDDEACIWTNGEIASLGHLPGGESGDSVAWDVTPDGTIIVGVSHTPEGGRAFRWENGEMEQLPVIFDGAQFAIAHHVSSDGDVITGIHSGQGSGMFIWDDVNGTRDLVVVLESFGIDMNGWTGMNVEDMSADGTVFVGTGRNPNDELEAWMAVIPRVVDTDGDGLLDSWETDGIDINGDGTIDLDLPAMGADPMHKDLFVEVDVMAGMMFDGGFVKAATEAAFQDAPVDNPDGVIGIKVHMDLTTVDAIPFEESWDDDFVAFGAIKSVFFGTEDERLDPNWEHIRAARQRVFRYCTVVNSFEGGALGWGELPGNDFMLACGGLLAGDIDLQASTFLHELGHNLGLDHGGGDSINYKPNYVSVMNYAFDLCHDNDGYRLKPEFSSEVIDALFEDNLDETIGLESIHYQDVNVFYGWRIPGEAPQIGWITLDQAMHDWNHDGELEQGVEEDLNWLGAGYPGGDAPSGGQLLQGYNDWEIIVPNLPFGTEGGYADGQHIRPPFEEQTEDDVRFLRANIPPPPINVAEIVEVQIVNGTILSGGPAELSDSDNAHLRILSGYGANITDLHHMEVIVSVRNVLADPTSIDLLVEAGVSDEPGQSRLALMNWNTGQFDIVDTSEIDGSTQSIVKEIDVVDYIDADGNLLLSIKHTVQRPYFAFQFESQIDYVQVTTR